jgi:large subunit ribosomal protein L21
LEDYVYAIVESGGRQYRAEEGHTFSVEKLPYEVGDSIELKDVLLLADGDKVKVGKPKVKGASVKATVIEQYRGEKILVFRYRSKQGFRRRKGHRQDYTRLRIDEIVAG